LHLTFFPFFHKIALFVGHFLFVQGFYRPHFRVLFLFCDFLSFTLLIFPSCIRSFPSRHFLPLRIAGRPRFPPPRHVLGSISVNLCLIKFPRFFCQFYLPLFYTFSSPFRPYSYSFFSAYDAVFFLFFSVFFFYFCSRPLPFLMLGEPPSRFCRPFLLLFSIFFSDEAALFVFFVGFSPPRGHLLFSFFPIFPLRGHSRRGLLFSFFCSRAHDFLLPYS